FRILNQLRGHFPHTRSMLMDESTLRDHLSLCVEEPIATRYTDKLDALDAEELAVYRLLLEDHLGESLRLEQERIGFSAVEQLVRELYI
ncbi:MAG: Wadjet anti-phage system protein JetD domain-containing protein, partial [Phycisphaeraceae bacterium]